ncbi:hypothetical protein ACO0QE_000527 [Hanseniaspora vineae]
MPPMKKLPACAQCRKRKVGCTRERPECSNCLKRGERCCYPESLDGRFTEILGECGRTNRVHKAATAGLLPSMDYLQKDRVARKNKRGTHESPMEMPRFGKFGTPSADEYGFMGHEQVYSGSNTLDNTVPDAFDSVASSSRMNTPLPQFSGVSTHHYPENSISNMNAAHTNEEFPSSNGYNGYTENLGENSSYRKNRFLEPEQLEIFDDLSRIMSSSKYDTVASYSKEELLDKQITLLKSKLDQLTKWKQRKYNNNSEFSSKALNSNPYDQSHPKFENTSYPKILMLSALTNEKLARFINNKFSTSVVDIDTEFFSESFGFKLFQNSTSPIFTLSKMFECSNELQKFRKNIFKTSKMKSFLNTSAAASASEIVFEPVTEISFPENSSECGIFWCEIFQDSFIFSSHIFSSETFSIFGNLRKFFKRLQDFDFHLKDQLTPDFMVKLIEYTFILLWSYYSNVYSSVFAQYEPSSVFYPYFQNLTLFVPHLEDNMKYAEQYMILNQSNKFLSFEHKFKLSLLFQIYHTYLKGNFSYQLPVLNGVFASVENKMGHLQLEHFLHLNFFQGDCSLELNHLDEFQFVQQKFITSVKKNNYNYSYQQLAGMLEEWKHLLQKNVKVEFDNMEDDLLNRDIEDPAVMNHVGKQFDDSDTVEQLLQKYKERLTFAHASLFINYYKLLDYQKHYYGDLTKLENETDLFDQFFLSCLSTIGTSFGILSNTKLGQYQVLISNFAYKALLAVTTMLFSIRYKNPKLIKTILIKFRLLMVEQTSGLSNKYTYNTEINIALDLYLHYFGFEDTVDALAVHVPALAESKEKERTMEHSKSENQASGLIVPAESFVEKSSVNKADDAEAEEEEEEEEEAGDEEVEDTEEDETETGNSKENNSNERLLKKISFYLMDKHSFAKKDMPETYGVQDETISEIYKFLTI